MTTYTLRRSALALRQHILIIIFTFTIVILVAVVTYSPWGRARSFDTYWAIGVPYLQFTMHVFVIFTSWTRMGWLWRSFAISLLLFLGVWAVGSLWGRWPQLPWNRAAGVRTADDFMLALKVKDYDKAGALFSPSTQDDYDYFMGKLRNPDAQPLDWQLAFDYDSHPYGSSVVVAGRATFADGIELPVELGLIWLNDHWRVNMVAFGQPGSPRAGIESTLRVYFSGCCDSRGPIEDGIHQVSDILISWLSIGR